MFEKKVDIRLEMEKLEIIRWVTSIRDRSMIDMLKMLKEDHRKIDWWCGVSTDEKKAVELRNLGIVE